MLKLNDTTYKQEIKTDKKDELSCIIGDDKQANFIPQMKIERFSNECNVSIRLIEDKDEEKETPVIIEENGKIKHIKSKRECHFYNLGVSAEHPEDASEFEVILKEDPRKNKGEDYTLEFSLEDKDVDYFRQEALTPIEIAEGATKAENVIGSYAVYAKTPKINYVSGKLYRDGKIGHIYRPKNIDAVGQESWGNLNINTIEKKLRVTILADFLDKAVYPVRHAAGLTFGYTSICSTATVVGLDMIRGMLGTAAQAGNVSSISFYSSSAGSHNVKGILVLKSSLNIVTNGVGNASVVGTSANWYTSTFATPPAVTAVDYYCCMIPDNADVQNYYESGVGAFVDATNSYASPTNPTDGTESAIYRRSYYATYTAGGGGTVQPNHLMNLMGCGN